MTKKNHVAAKYGNMDRKGKGTLCNLYWPLRYTHAWLYELWLQGTVLSLILSRPSVYNGNERNNEEKVQSQEVPSLKMH